MFFSHCQTNGPWFYQFRFECFLDTGYDQPESSKDESGKKKRSPHQMVVFLFFFHVMCILIFFNSYLKMAGVGNFWIGKTFFSFFSVCRLCPPLHHHGLSYETVFIFIFEKIRHWINKNRGKPERTLSYGKRRLHAKQASKKQKGKAVGYSLIKGKLKLQDVSITSHKRHKVVLSRPLRAKT